MKTKHTPGPWMTKEGQIYPEETGKTIALLCYFDENDETQVADAQIMASAPEMLVMLMEVYKKLYAEGRADQKDLRLSIFHVIREASEEAANCL